MTVTLVCDPSEAMELCASQQLYLKPVAKLTISVVLPEHTGPTWAFSKWEVMDKLKNMICPDQFTSVRVSKSTKGFIRFEGEAETKRLVCSLKEKLHGKMIKLNGFKDDLQVVATEEPPDLPASQEVEPILNDGELLDEDFAEQSRAVPGCIHLEGLPCKWFALKGSDSETPSEDVLRAVFESFGKIKNVDIPMLDPYREEMVGGNVNNFTFRGLRTFEAYVQYQEPMAFAKAMETLKGMKLMFKGDDGKALACNIKVTSDTTDHFSESAINQRHLERLTLQGLERERKREENRGKKGTERKRRDDDDEKKVGEGKRKSKLKRREKRQIDRDEKRPRKQQKVTTGEELWPENMPEWEERKYLLAQRRVESIRLLTVLLSQIKDFVLSSRQIGEPLLDCGCEREDCISAPQIQNEVKENTDTHYFRHQELKNEAEPLCQSAQMDNTHLGREEEDDEDDDSYVAVDFPVSPHPLTRTVLNQPAARTIISCSTEKDMDCCLSWLRVTFTQDCPVLTPPAREDDLSLNRGCCPKVSNGGNCRKQKVYETEEFIHYLLNYYQTPRYARICPGMQSAASESCWQRVVIDDGNAFQVNLKNKDGPCTTEVRFASNFQEGESMGDDDYQWEMIDEKPESTEVMQKSQACTRELSETCPVQWGDYSLGEASNRTPCDELDRPFLLNISTAYDKKSHEENTGMAIVPSHKAFGRMYKLKDLLEEISSDSEYFSEASESHSKMDKRNGSCRSLAWPLSRQKARELLICVQNVARNNQDGEGSKRSFCSNLECFDLTRNSGQSLKTTFKKSSSRIRHEGHKTKWMSSEEEREAGKKRKKKKKRSLEDPLPDNEPRFFKTNHCGELESLDKMQRKCSKMLHHKMKGKKLHAMARALKANDAIYLGASQFQEAHQEAGKGQVDFIVASERGFEMEGRQSTFKASVKR